MSEKTCAVCGKTLTPREVRINEMRRTTSLKKLRYLCERCRQREYQEYMREMKKLMEKTGS